MSALEVAVKALEAAREREATAIDECEQLLKVAKEAVDGSPKSLRAVADGRRDLKAVQEWHAAKIAPLLVAVHEAQAAEADAAREAEIRAYGDSLVSRGKALAESQKTIKALTKTARKILDSAATTGLALPPEPAEHVKARIPELVAELAANQPIRVAYDLATAPVRRTPTNGSRYRKEVPAVDPFAALHLALESIDDEAGLAALAEASDTFRELGAVLGRAAGKVRALKERRTLLAEDRDDNLRDQAVQLVGQEQREREAELRAQILEKYPSRFTDKEGVISANNSELLDVRVREQLRSEGWFRGTRERTAARMAELSANLN